MDKNATIRRDLLWRRLEAHAHLWDVTALCANRSLPLEFVATHLDWPWHWPTLTRSQQTMDAVLAHPHLPWDWPHVHQIPKCTLAHVSALPDKPWDWWRLSWFSDLTDAHVLAHADKPWDWSTLSGRDGVTTALLDALPHKPWDMTAFSRKMCVLEVTDADVGRHVAATTIQGRWRASIADPAHPLCVRRLRREHGDLLHASRVAVACSSRSRDFSTSVRARSP